MKCYSPRFPFVHINFGFVSHAKMCCWKSLCVLLHGDVGAIFELCCHALSLRVRASICLSVCLSFCLSISVCTSLRGIQWNNIFRAKDKVRLMETLPLILFRCLVCCCLFVYISHCFFSRSQNDCVCERVVTIFGKSFLQSKVSKQHWFKITLHFKMSFSFYPLLRIIIICYSNLKWISMRSYIRNRHTYTLTHFIWLVRYFYLFGR